MTDTDESQAAVQALRKIVAGGVADHGFSCVSSWTQLV
jgi:hypothetical protein